MKQMQEMKDYYGALGVALTASSKDIKQQYRRLAKQFHPDVNQGNPAAEEQFKRVVEAYEVLSDPNKRRQYDMLLVAEATGVRKTVSTELRDLEVIARTASSVTRSSFSYSDFYEAYDIWKRLRAVVTTLQDYGSGKSVTTRDLVNAINLANEFQTKGKRLGNIAERNFTTLGKLSAMLSHYETAEKLAKKRRIDLREAIRFY